MSSALVLIVGMLVSGVCNTILNKLQDRQCVADCDSSDPKLFEQPVWQTLNMFVGETFCVVAVFVGHHLAKRHAATTALPHAPQPHVSSHHEDIAPSAVNELVAGAIVDDVENAKLIQLSQHGAQPLEGWSRLLFWLPTLCDLTATTLMNVGLIYTAASIYQMLRGFVIIMTALFSVMFLNRKLHAYQWVSLFIVVIGLAIVGLSSLDAAFELEGLIGIGLVLLAQVFTATQFVVEEKIMSHYHVEPIMAVALEGSFGLVTVLASMPLLYYTIGRTHESGGYFDFPEGFNQIISHTALWTAAVAICFSIAFFNFFGLSVTKKISATVRSLIDTCRTLFIWLISIYLGWERFRGLQVVGFTLLVLGTFGFNDVFHYFKPRAEPEEREPLLQEN